MSIPPKPRERLDARPLYQQVESVLIDRIAGGEWPPGHALPAEPELAAELGVSQGTVRKALAELERRNLIERRQGRGTTVLRHTGDTARFHFFRLRDLEGTAVVSRIVVLSCEAGEADAAEAANLRLPQGTPVFRLRRLRLVEDTPRIFERCTLVAERLPGFHLPQGDLTTELYVHLQRAHGVTIEHAEEDLSAQPAGPEEAEVLGLPEGKPLLMVQRLAFDIARRVVEHRVSLIDTEHYRYAVRLD
ncbi:GntR family transcriptional regulator [Roseomonas marmotae]|uniref:GntR family transcriptional regulator n=1 Tax=Roseomonas marmotae TaxID=2768161 RepID=A0ABS3KAB3_9PROT|nr:GntR family transcriptional regulator [Roseomonas marmotae]MBO1074414.1 GntR family transcriptional regulator [Roseomonas marmotae]QTI78154.1 GntR family transcriptional regulator [Roseomonas marmotae]